jgi:hypothetical protein
MTLPRRRFLHLAAGAAALPAVSPMANAQAFPGRTVRIVVGFPVGRLRIFHRERRRFRIVGSTLQSPDPQ